MWLKPSGNKSQTGTAPPGDLTSCVDGQNSVNKRVMCVHLDWTRNNTVELELWFIGPAVCLLLLLFNRFPLMSPSCFTLLSPFQTNPSWWGQGNIVKDFLWLLMISWVFIRATMLSDLVTYLAHCEGITFQSIPGHY